MRHSDDRAGQEGGAPRWRGGRWSAGRGGRGRARGRAPVGLGAPISLADVKWNDGSVVVVRVRVIRPPDRSNSTRLRVGDPTGAVMLDPRQHSLSVGSVYVLEATAKLVRRRNKPLLQLQRVRSEEQDSSEAVCTGSGAFIFSEAGLILFANMNTTDVMPLKYGLADLAEGNAAAHAQRWLRAHLRGGGCTGWTLRELRSFHALFSAESARVTGPLPGYMFPVQRGHADVIRERHPDIAELLASATGAELGARGAGAADDDNEEIDTDDDANFDFPKGAIDAVVPSTGLLETPRAAAKREAVEELKMRPDQLEQMVELGALQCRAVQRLVSSGEGGGWEEFYHVFVFAPAGGNLFAAGGDQEVARLRFVPTDELRAARAAWAAATPGNAFAQREFGPLSSLGFFVSEDRAAGVEAMGVVVDEALGLLNGPPPPPASVAPAATVDAVTDQLAALSSS